MLERSEKRDDGIVVDDRARLKKLLRGRRGRAGHWSAEKALRAESCRSGLLGLPVLTRIRLLRWNPHMSMIFGHHNCHMSMSFDPSLSQFAITVGVVKPKAAAAGGSLARPACARLSRALLTEASARPAAAPVASARSDGGLAGTRPAPSTAGRASSPARLTSPCDPGGSKILHLAPRR